MDSGELDRCRNVVAGRLGVRVTSRPRVDQRVCLGDGGHRQEAHVAQIAEVLRVHVAGVRPDLREERLVLRLLQALQRPQGLGWLQPLVPAQAEERPLLWAQAWVLEQLLPGA